jgi:hypothetical protein
MPVIRPPSNPLSGEPLAPDDLQSSAMDLMGPGFSIAKVLGRTPAANALMNFVRRQWPALGRKADNLPDIDLFYADTKHADKSQGLYYRPELSGAPGGAIDIAQHPKAESSYPGMEAARTLVHELLHAIYNHKNKFGPLAGHGVPNIPTHTADTIMTKAQKRGNFTPGRHQQFLDIANKAGEVYPPAGDRELRHGALDAMANNIVMEKFPQLRNTGRLQWQGAHPRPQGGGVQNLWLIDDAGTPTWLTDDILRARHYTPPLP